MSLANLFGTSLGNAAGTAGRKSSNNPLISRAVGTASQYLGNHYGRQLGNYANSYVTGKDFSGFTNPNYRGLGSSVLGGLVGGYVGGAVGNAAGNWAYKATGRPEIAMGVGAGASHAAGSAAGGAAAGLVTGGLSGAASGALSGISNPIGWIALGIKAAHEKVKAGVTSWDRYLTGSAPIDSYDYYGFNETNKKIPGKGYEVKAGLQAISLDPREHLRAPQTFHKGVEDILGGGLYKKKLKKEKKEAERLAIMQDYHGVHNRGYNVLGNIVSDDDYSRALALSDLSTTNKVLQRFGGAVKKDDGVWAASQFSRANPEYVMNKGRELAQERGVQNLQTYARDWNASTMYGLQNNVPGYLGSILQGADYVQTAQDLIDAGVDRSYIEKNIGRTSGAERQTLLSVLEQMGK